MKKTILLFIVWIAVSFVAFGQTDSPAFNDFIARLQLAQKQYHQYYEEKNYVQTEASLREMLTLVENVQLTPDETDKHSAFLKYAKAGTYYNLACTYSLMKRKKQAVTAFEKAIDLGYTKYRHIKKDTDLDYIRKEKKFITLLEKIKQFDPLVILQHVNGYQKENTDSLPTFTYQSAENQNLKEVRAFFKLDSVAGTGDELSKIIRLLQFVHNTIKHNGGNFALCEFDAIDIYNYHKSTGKGVNCRHLAIALNEMYLSMDIPSRYITCMPRSADDPDCHVINSVYSSQLKKWLWIDPTFNAYVKDENGNMLSIAEVRERLITGKPVVLNEDANWNNQTPQTKEHYLDYYMAKNLYWFDCLVHSQFNPESRYRKTGNRYISLKPVGFGEESPGNGNTSVTRDSEYFWQAPASK